MKTTIELGDMKIQEQDKTKRPTVKVTGMEDSVTTAVKEKKKKEDATEAYNDTIDLVKFEANNVKKTMEELERTVPENITFVGRNGKRVAVTTTYKSAAMDKDTASEVKEHLPKGIAKRLVEEKHSITLTGVLASRVVRLLIADDPDLGANVKHHDDFSETRTCTTTKDAYKVVQELREDYPELKDLFAKLAVISAPGLTAKVEDK